MRYTGRRVTPLIYSAEMRDSTAATVAGYIAGQPPTARAALKKVRQIVRNAVPEVIESISYGMPTFTLRGKPLLYLGAWKQHYALYPSSDRLVAAVGPELDRYERSKGTIKFPYGPVPEALIRRIALARAAILAHPDPPKRRAKR